MVNHYFIANLLVLLVLLLMLLMQLSQLILLHALGCMLLPYSICCLTSMFLGGSTCMLVTPWKFSLAGIFSNLLQGGMHSPALQIDNGWSLGITPNVISM